ncbi:MAG: hypothetical protein GXY03_00510 [Solirubrobacterales bacterium]|nr:hypothetical protein [Solirubrobacterales bacterium]
MRIVSWNVEGVGQRGPAHMERIGEVLRLLSPTVALIQEIKCADADATRTVADLARLCGMTAYMADGRAVVSHGWRRLRTAVLWGAGVAPVPASFRAYPDVPSLAHVDAVVNGGGRVRLASYHAPAWGITRRLAMGEQVLGDMMGGPPAIVGMDRNAIGAHDPEPPRDVWYPRRLFTATYDPARRRASEDRSMARLWTDAEMVDVGDRSPWVPTTGHARYDPHAAHGVKRRIDAVYVSPTLSEAVRGYAVADPTQYSDHCAVVVDLDAEAVSGAYQGGAR